MNVLIETYQRLLKESSPAYVRQFYMDFSFEHRLMGIVGSRGVGKTTFILHYLKTHYPNSDQALYVSADHMIFTEMSLLDLADRFHKEFDGKLLCIDEIHRYKNWNQELKNIYDSYPKMQILFSGSSSINLVKGKYDLSRRSILKHMSGFSFREYLEVKLNKAFPLITLADIVRQSTKTSDILSTPKLLGHLKAYLESGLYPIFLELKTVEAYQQALIAMVDKTIYEDISTFYALKTKNLDAFRKILYFIATSKPGEFSINKLANSLKKDHTTTSEYLEMLRESGLLRYLINKKRGHALVRAAEKIYLDNANILHAINSSLGQEPELGTLRECFVIQSLQAAGYPVFYSEQGDLQCQGMVFEVGGRSKTGRQIKGVDKSFLVLDDVLASQKNIIPMCLLGFLS